MTALDRTKARVVLASRLPDDPKWATWIDGTLDALEGCVVEDPRIDRIRALHYESDTLMDGVAEATCVTCDELWPCDTAQILDGNAS